MCLSLLTTYVIQAAIADLKCMVNLWDPSFGKPPSYKKTWRDIHINQHHWMIQKKHQASQFIPTSSFNPGGSKFLVSLAPQGNSWHQPRPGASADLLRGTSQGCLFGGLGGRPRVTGSGVACAANSAVLGAGLERAVAPGPAGMDPKPNPHGFHTEISG